MSAAISADAAIALPDEAATIRVAGAVAAGLRAGDSLLLEGPIGSGKTSFARALIRARLGAPGLEVPSPTFTLVQTYGAGPDEIWHCDLYRLAAPGEALELGLGEALGRAICLVEWPDRLGPLAPGGAVRLRFAAGADGAHSLAARGSPADLERLGLAAARAGGKA